MKRFLTALLLVVANFFVMPPVDAEIQTYTGTDEYIVGEHETHEVAKNNSKIRAMRNAQDQAGVFIRSRSRTKDLELVDDEIVTLTEGILKVVGAPIHEIRLLGDGKGILIHTTIKVEIDTDDLDRRLAEIARVHDTNKPSIDRPKPLEAPEPEKISPPTPDKTVDNIALSKAKSDEGWKLCKTGKFREAIPVLNEALNLNPNNSDAYRNLGWAYRELNDYDKAIFYCTKAIEVEQNHKWTYNTLAGIYYKLKDYEKAISYCNKTIKLDPNIPNPYHWRGLAHMRLKNYRQAVSDFSRAAELEPTDTWHYDCLGWAYNCLGEYYKAISMLDKAIQLDTNNAYAYEKLALAYRGLKQYKKAISYCDKSIKINPNDPNYPWAYVTRGKCYEALGEHDKARADFAKARQLGWKG